MSKPPRLYPEFQPAATHVSHFNGPAGAPDFKALAPAYRELLTNLYLASYAWREEGDGGIKGAQLACRAIVRFVGVRHQNPELAAPFLDLLAAFEDLRTNLDPELFSNQLKVRERPRTTRGWHLRMLASVAMDVLMELGDSKNVAANVVARHVAHWPGVGSKTISAGTIARWRHEYAGLGTRKNYQFHLLRDHILEQPDARRTVERFLKEPRVLPKNSENPP
jgi:hypothetical protein